MRSGVWRGVGAASVLAWLLAACSPRPDGPAPVIGGEPEQHPASITVQRGQTLSGIAHAHHVPMRVIAEANHLSPPYRIEAGRTLLIPEGAQPAIPPVSVAALPPAGPQIASAPSSPEAIPAAPADKSPVAAVTPPPPAPVTPPPALPS